jgi:phosphomannomutase/phosphoglucomutase
VEEIAALQSLVERGPFADGQGVAHPVQIKGAYVKWLDAAVAPLLTGVISLRVVVDAGNGSYWEIGPAAFRRAGFEVVELFCSPDGRFPSRPPNPAVAENLRALSAAVIGHHADLGIAFDGDGDRVAFADERGNIIPSDRFLAVMARDVLRREGAGKVVLDIKCSKAVADVVNEAQGEVVLERSGHTFIKRRMLTENAVFGGELSGHMFYRALGGRDDGLYSALRMAALVARSRLPFSKLIRAVPQYVTTPDLRVPFHGDRDEVLARIAEGLSGVPISRLDGVRADFAEGWALARASVTEPALTFRFEVLQSSDLQLVIDRFLGRVPEVQAAIEGRLRDQAGAKGAD